MTIPPEKITKGADVKATLAAVTTGDADAAIVYVTDAKAAGTTVQAVRIPAWQNVYAIYPIAPLAARRTRTSRTRASSTRRRPRARRHCRASGSSRRRSE